MSIFVDMKHIKLVIFASELHDRASVMTTRDGMFAYLRKHAELEVVYPSMLKPRCSSTGKYYDEYSENEKVEPHRDDSRTICFIATGGTEEIFRACLDSIEAPVILLSDGFHNSLAAALEISTFLSEKGIKRSLYNAPLEYTDEYFAEFVEKIFQENHEHPEPEEIDRTIPVFGKNLLRAIAKTRIGLIGGQSPWLISSDVNRKYLCDNYKVKFEDIGLDELETEFENTKADNPEISGIRIKMSRFLSDDRTEEDLTNAARMYLALRNICTRYNLNALTIKCFGILNNCGTTACLALSLLNDSGIVAGCEGDLPTLWTMLYAKLACHKTSFMANPSSTNRDELTIDFAHCTIPLSMVHGYRLPSHFESSIGIGIAGSVPCGRYRIIKFSGEKLESFFCVEGDILMNTNVPQRCRTQVRFKFDSIKDLDSFLSESKGNHIVLIPA